MTFPRIHQLEQPARQRWPSRRSRAGKRRFSPYWFLVPATAFVIVFIAYPLITGVQLSFENAHSLSGGKFAGLSNYRHILDSTLFTKGLMNNTEFFLGSIFLLTPVAFVLALCLYSRQSLFRGAVRLILLVPLSTSTVVVAIIFSQLLGQRFGLYDYWLRLLGVGAVPWLTSPRIVMLSLVLLAMWGYMGLNVAYILAGLRGIGVEVLEAARIDGASYARTVRSVLLPNLRGILVFVGVQAIVGSYQLFARPDVLTQGGPQDASYTGVYYIYNEALQQFNLGASAAAGLVLMLVIVSLSAIVLGLARIEWHWLRMKEPS